MQSNGGARHIQYKKDFKDTTMNFRSPNAIAVQ